MVEQFGTAMTPSCSIARAPLTSGTTRGTPESIRKAEDLSRQTAPLRAAWGTSSSDAAAPTAKRKKSTSEDASVSGVAPSTTRPSSSIPAELAEAKRRTFSYPRSRRIERATAPTAPVAPTTPMRGWALGMGPFGFWPVQLEARMQCLHRLLHLSTSDVGRDLDRRGREDLGLDLSRCERREEPRCHTRVALHACADQADLAQVVAHAPLHA